MSARFIVLEYHVFGPRTMDKFIHIDRTFVLGYFLTVPKSCGLELVARNLVRAGQVYRTLV